MTFIASFELSIQIHFLFNILDAMNVVQEPQKQSSTISFSFDDISIILFNNSIFF